MLKKHGKILFSLGTLSIITIPIATVSCNISFNYKPTFWNYEDYMSESGISSINSSFKYKQFGDVPEMGQSLNEGRTVGGIASDYYNAKWAAEGLIKKINFHKAFHMDFSSKNELKANLKKGYTPEAWKQLETFNQYLIDKHVDQDKDGIIDEMWEFMIPYFMQSKVVAFNLARGSKQWKNKVKSVKTQANIEALFPDKSYAGILKVLHTNGYNNFVVNNYTRDNMMIGSELKGNFTGKLTLNNYKKFIDGYVETLKTSMNIDVKDGNKSIFETSGTAALDHLVNPSENWGVSILYQGDALFAHYGGSKDSPQGKNIRIVTPKSPVFQLDGLVLASTVKDDSDMENNFYRDVYNGFLKGWSDKLDKGYNNSKPYGDNLPPAANNFDAINYTTPYADVYNRFKKGGIDDYFKSDSGLPQDYDVFGESIFHTASSSLMNFNTSIQPIDDNLQYKYQNYYLSKTS